MQIKDLQAKQGKVEITLDIVDVSPPRSFEKFGRQGKVANAIAKDSSGDIKLTLWNDDIDKIKAGDKIKITDGYVSEWQGELQLGTGKYGKIEVVGASDQETKEETSMPDEQANKKMYEQEKAKIDSKESSLNKPYQSKPAAPQKKLEEMDEIIEEEPVIDEEDVADE